MCCLRPKPSFPSRRMKMSSTVFVWLIWNQMVYWISTGLLTGRYILAYIELYVVVKKKSLNPIGSEKLHTKHKHINDISWHPIIILRANSSEIWQFSNLCLQFSLPHTILIICGCSRANHTLSFGVDGDGNGSNNYLESTTRINKKN